MMVSVVSKVNSCFITIVLDDRPLRLCAAAGENEFYFVVVVSFFGWFLPVLNNKGTLLPGGETRT